MSAARFQLSDLNLDEVSVVTAGDNPEAHIAIFKARDLKIDGIEKPEEISETEDGLMVKDEGGSLFLVQNPSVAKDDQGTLLKGDVMNLSDEWQTARVSLSLKDASEEVRKGFAKTLVDSILKTFGLEGEEAKEASTLNLEVPTPTEAPEADAAATETVETVETEDAPGETEVETVDEQVDTPDEQKGDDPMTTFSADDLKALGIELSEDQVEKLNKLAKGKVEKVESEEENPVFKGLSPEQVTFFKAQQSVIEKMQRESEEREYIEKARKDYGNLPATADELGPVLRRVDKGEATAEDSTYIQNLLASASSLASLGKAFDEYGSSVAKSGTPAYTVEQKAREVAKRDSISMEMAFAKVRKENPDLTREYTETFRSE